MLTAIFFALAVARPFHAHLTSNAAQSFPLVARFGTITVDLYPRGFRATSIWLRGFGINGQHEITVENPLTRTYTKMPSSGIGDIARFVAGRTINIGAPVNVLVSAGNVGKLPSHRYRLVYGPDEYVDVWTTAAIGPAPAFREVVDELIRALSPESERVLRQIPDTPIYVEMNVGRYRNLPILQPSSVVFNSTGEAEALRVSPWMFPVPSGAIFK